MDTIALDKALDLLLRLPPQLIEKSYKGIIKLRPELQEDLSSAVDIPFKTCYDSFYHKEFLKSNFNEDAGCYRSPWSNKYFPNISDGLTTQSHLRNLEIKANEAFKKYMDMYYESGTSSVFCWELDQGFAVSVLFKKVGKSMKKVQGSWDSVHVIQVTELNGSIANYKITSAIMLWLHTRNINSGVMNISGSITRQNERNCRLLHATSHIINLGELVEEMENHMRHSLYDIYFWKTKDVSTRYLRYCIQSEAEERLRSRMIDVKLERSRSAAQASQRSIKRSIQRTPSGKHILVPMQNSFKV